MLQQLTSPYVVQEFDYLMDGGETYLVQEYVRGVELSEWQQETRPMHELIRLYARIAQGLADVHDAGVVHRDLKPDNVIVGSDGHAKILDFGLAKLRQQNEQQHSRPDTRMDTISAEMTQEGVTLRLFVACGLAEEVLVNYDVDGIDLDFLRHICYFRETRLYQPVTPTHRDMLTDVVRQIREHVLAASQRRAGILARGGSEHLGLGG